MKGRVLLRMRADGAGPEGPNRSFGQGKDDPARRAGEDDFYQAMQKGHRKNDVRAYMEAFRLATVHGLGAEALAAARRGIESVPGWEEAFVRETVRLRHEDK